jgi:anhydro-N-acetylmuramic acid kinase
MTAQLGDGAAIASATQLPVVSDLRALDIAFGGQGAPIVPIGEKLLLGNYDYFLNLGGIANISIKPASIKEEGGEEDPFVAFDICPANRVLNMLANEAGAEYDKDGKMASQGKINNSLLDILNGLSYYDQPYPKSLANDFGTDIVYPIIKEMGISINDAMSTYVEHIAAQIHKSIVGLKNFQPVIARDEATTSNLQLLVTGGGAFNTFMIQELKEKLSALNIEVIVPDKNLVNFKEAMIMALIGVLRWREEYNVISSVTGAARASVGGALWMGQEA